MPKFVPVVDNEKSQAEQREDTEFDKHRRFDNPHKVDRGWQQGNVGWGVLGAFGSNSKDDAAQIIKRAEVSNKMIKNEKGLWVKAKELEEDTPQQQSRPGRGRGGGVSVYDEMASRTMGSADAERKSEPPRKGQYDDLGETHTKRHKQVHDSTDRHDDKRDGRHRDSDRRDDRSRDAYSKSNRSRSRSPNRRRDDRDRDDRRDDRRDGGRDNRRHGDRSSKRDRSRSRSRSYDRHRRRDDRSDRQSDSRRSRSRSPARKEPSRRDSRDRHDNRETERRSDKSSPEHTHRNSSPTDTKKEPHTSTSPELSAEEAALQAEMMNSITAVQVINRFHEVFGQDKLSSSQRLSQIGQVFSPGAVIASLKSGVVHITGKTGVEDSFAKTAASVPAISKRIYVEHSTDTTESTTDVPSTTPAAPTTPKVTFCLDFHRPGAAPGLGDRAKHNVLLYRCAGAQITHIWGMVDHEQLSQPEELEQGVIMKSKAWALAKPIVLKDIGAFDEARDAHFHNYDRMEVWGMF